MKERKQRIERWGGKEKGKTVERKTTNLDDKKVSKQVLNLSFLSKQQKIDKSRFWIQFTNKTIETANNWPKMVDYLPEEKEGENNKFTQKMNHQIKNRADHNHLENECESC